MNKKLTIFKNNSEESSKNTQRNHRHKKAKNNSDRTNQRTSTSNFQAGGSNLHNRKIASKSTTTNQPNNTNLSNIFTNHDTNEAYKFVKEKLLLHLGKCNKIFTNHNKKTQDKKSHVPIINFNNNDSIETLASKSGEASYNLTKIDHNIIIIHEDLDDTDEIGLYIFDILILLFHKQFEYKKQKSLFQFIQPKHKQDEIANVQKTINFNSIIKDLEKLKENFFPLLNSTLDPNLSLNEKTDLWWEHFNIENAIKNFAEKNNLINRDLNQYHTKQLTRSWQKNYIAYLISLQNYIDGLKLISKLPNENNLKIAFILSKQCHQFFNEDFQMMQESTILDSKFGENYLNVISKLEILCEMFEPKKNEQIQEPISPNAQETQPTSSSIEEKPEIEEQKPIELLTINTIPSLPPIPTTITTPVAVVPPVSPDNALSGEEQKPLELLTEHIIINTLPPLLPIPTTITTPMAEVLPISPDSSSSEESSDQDTNDYMKLFLQFLDKDRKAKLERKAEKQYTKKIQPTYELEPEELTTLEMQENQGPKIIKLSTDQMQLVRDLFQQYPPDFETFKPPHITLLGKDIETLINKLNGRLEGQGNGSKYKIFWGNSQRQAGKFKIAHEGDIAGYVTSGWAIRAAEAIQVGIDHGEIAEETITQAFNP